MQKTALYGIIAAVVVAAGIGIAFAAMSMNNTAEPAVASPQSTDDEVRVVKHAMGETEITGTPERVVTLYSVFTGDVRALGMQPAGTADRDWINGWLTPLGLPLSEEVVDVGIPSEPNLEAILQLEPDLIIGHGGVWGDHDEMYEELNEIAPTLIFDDAPAGSELDELEVGKQNFMAIADALNRHDEGSAYLQKIESQYDAAAQRIEQAGMKGTKFVLAQAYLQNDAPGAYIFSQNSFTTKVLNNIGLVNEVPDPTDTTDKWYQTDMEGLTTVDKPDTHLFVTYNAGQYESNPLAKSPLWRNFEFVKDGRAHDIGHTRVFGQVIFIEEIVNRVVDAMTSDNQVRTISHAAGTTEITGTPERIVAVGPEFIEHLVTLGVQPAGIVDSSTFRLWYPSMAEKLSPDVVDLGDYPPNLEAIAQLEPDLIMAGPDLYGEFYEDLDSIAPTVMFALFPEQGGPTQLERMEEVHMKIADIVGRQDRAAANIESMHAKFDEAAGKLEAAGVAGHRFVYVEAGVWEDAPWMNVYAENAELSLILEEMGMENAVGDDVEFSTYGFISSSLEGLASLDGPDVHMFYTTALGDDVFENSEYWSENPVWTDLEFVKNGQVHNLGKVYAFAGPSQAELLADKVVEALAEDTQP